MPATINPHSNGIGKDLGVISTPSDRRRSGENVNWRIMTLARASHSSLVPVIRREIAAVDNGLPAYDVKTMEEVVGESVRTRRMMAGLLATLAILALLLAVAGTYGVMAYAVDRRLPGHLRPGMAGDANRPARRAA
jgi:hypothetical protein